MTKWIARLSAAMATLLVLARAAAAQDYVPPPQPVYAPAYGYSDGRAAPPAPSGCCAGYSVPAPPPQVYRPGPASPCCAGAPTGDYGTPQGRPRIYVEDMYGQWHEATGEEYARVYAYAQQQPPQPGSPYQYVNVPGPCCVRPPAVPPPVPAPPSYPPSCGGCCPPQASPGYPPAAPSCPPSHPPGYGEIRLNDSFFYGAGGVGPEIIYYGGGGGGGYAYAGASSSSYASAGASARITFGGGGGYRPPPPRGGGHKPPGRGGGCGCH